MSTKDVSDGQFDEETGLNLFDDTAAEDEDIYSLIWSRARRQNGD